jgi:hypothetical protein
MMGVGGSHGLAFRLIVEDDLDLEQLDRLVDNGGRRRPRRRERRKRAVSFHFSLPSADPRGTVHALPQPTKTFDRKPLGHDCNRHGQSMID